MADKRIIELDSKDAVAVDDYVAVDGQTGGTKKFPASQLGGKAEVMTEAEWEDLPSDKYTDNKVYVLTDAEPPESQLFAKVGSASLDTSADNLSDAINEHESDISTLNSKMVKAVNLSGTTDARGRLMSDFDISDKIVVGVLSGTNGDIALQLRLSNNKFAVKFLTSDTMEVVANTSRSINVYYVPAT